MQSSPPALFTPLQWGLNVVFTPNTVQTFILVCVMAHTLHVQQKNSLHVRVCMSKTLIVS